MSKNVYILGVHYAHDATVALMKDGEIVEAMSEERLTRLKKYSGFPFESLKYIKEKYPNIIFDKVIISSSSASRDSVLFTTKSDNIKGRSAGPRRGDYFLRGLGVRFPFLGRLFYLRDFYIQFFERFGTEKKVDAFLKNVFGNIPIERIEHHFAHAWCAPLFFENLEQKKIILTLDGVGDEISGSVNIFDGKNIIRKSSIPVDASIGMLYCGIVDILGMSRNEHEFKVMGLAPYAKQSSGEKVFNRLKELIWFDEENMTLKSSLPQGWTVAYATHYLIANNFCHYRFDSLAYGVQKLTEELIKDIARAAIKKYDIKDVAVAGGVFMNVKANQYLLELPEVNSLTVVPSCGDESLALGACAYGYSSFAEDNIKKIKKIKNLYLGSFYTNQDIKKVLEASNFIKNSCNVSFFDKSKGESIERKVAELLSKNQVVGRFKGRSEWGARALGNRSILANPTSRDNIKLINEMIKGRDFWMPFATSLLYEDRDVYLDIPKSHFAPYMAITFKTKEKAHLDLIAALHPYDLTSRPQMVTKDMNEEYHALITYFKELTGTSGVLNTSFNLHGEPNVEKPQDAIDTLEHSGLKYLALGDYLVEKL